MDKTYTGVGARKTPLDILDLMQQLARKLATRGVILRSGGAAGADSAFESGAGRLKQIFYASDATPAAMEIAAVTHPAWNRCSDYARKLHARNAFQILGANLDTPSNAVICWTPDGCTNHFDRSIKTGGTGTAISIAHNHSVPVWNLRNTDHRARWVAWLQN